MTTKRNAKLRKRKVPKWALELMASYVADFQKLAETTELAKAGISVIQGMGDLASALAKVTEERIDTKQARRAAKLAQHESENEFPWINGQTVVTYWGYLESMIRSIGVAFLLNERQTWSHQEMDRVRVKVGEYEALTKQERCYFVLDSLERERAVSLKLGAGRFESTLAVFKLDGGLSVGLRKALLELQQVRNVLVHSMGKS